jgi:hypothetical protein
MLVLPNVVGKGNPDGSVHVVGPSPVPNTEKIDPCAMPDEGMPGGM